MQADKIERALFLLQVNEVNGEAKVKRVELCVVRFANASAAPAYPRRLAPFSFFPYNLKTIVWARYIKLGGCCSYILS